LHVVVVKSHVLLWHVKSEDQILPSTFVLAMTAIVMCTGWLWHNFFRPYLRQLFSYHDVEQAVRNVCYFDITYNDTNICLQFYSNNMTNLHHLTSDSKSRCPVM